MRTPSPGLTRSEGDVNSSPPLVTNFAQMDQALDILDACLAEEAA
jgi:hypothetical protein